MTKKILIEGMSCNHCVNHVKEALEELNGATKATVDLDTKSAVLEASRDIEDEAIKSAIDEAGYDVVNIQVL